MTQYDALLEYQNRWVVSFCVSIEFPILTDARKQNNTNSKTQGLRRAEDIAMTICRIGTTVDGRNIQNFKTLVSDTTPSPPKFNVNVI